MKNRNAYRREVRLVRNGIELQLPDAQGFKTTMTQSHSLLTPLFITMVARFVDVMEKKVQASQALPW